MTIKQDLLDLTATVKDKIQAAFSSTSFALNAISSLETIVGNLFYVKKPVLRTSATVQMTSGQMAAARMAVNYYPHSIEFYKGFIYLSTVGCDNLTDPLVSGPTKFQKIDPKTRTIVDEYVGGQYAQSGLGNGLNGFCIHDGKAYVANNHHMASPVSSEIAVIDLETMDLITTISIGAGGCRHCVHDGEKLWVAQSGPDNLKRIDLTTNTVDLTISMSGTPFRMFFAFGSVWLALYSSHIVRRINPSDGSTIADISCGPGPNWFDADENYVYVGCYGTLPYVTDSTARRIDPLTNTVQKTYTLAGGDCPHHVFPISNEVWVACSGSHKIKVFNKESGALIQTKDVPQNPPSLCFDGTCIAHGCGNEGVVQFHILDLYFED